MSIANDKKASLKQEAFFVSTPQKSSGYWRCGDFKLNYRKRPLLMGVLNVTPDSFSDGGQFLKPQKAIDQALRLEAEGADIIDIGGESTRPGALPVSFEEEQKRVLPVIQELAKKVSVPLSIDTRKPELAKIAIESGASIINDVGGENGDPEMILIAALNKKTGIIFMHAKGSPQTMQKAPRYKNLFRDISNFFFKRIQAATDAQILRNRIAIDPGIGFGKTIQHNLKIIHHLHDFKDFGLPILLGPSRKSFIGHILNLPASDRLEGTAAAVAISVFNGANILRVHDVQEMKRVIALSEAIRKQTPSTT